MWRNLANTLEIFFDYLLQHGAHVDIAIAAGHVVGMRAFERLNV